MCIRDSIWVFLEIDLLNDNDVVVEAHTGADLHPRIGSIVLSLIHISEPTRPY